MFSKFFIHRPRFAFVISIVITIAGMIAIYSLPVAQYPQITPPQVQISTSYPGASADVVQKCVVAPIETQVNGVKNMLYMSSTSANDGSATITVTFEIGTDGDMNTVNVQNRVSIATPQLPSEVTKQGVTVKEKSNDMLLIVNLFSPKETYDGLYLSNYTSINILDTISRVHGVGDAQILGQQDYSMRIWLNPDRLAGLGMTVDDVTQAIEEQNAQVAAGQIGAPPSPNNQQFQYTIRVKGRLTSVKEFGNIIVRANSDGSMVRIRDVARVERGAADYSSFGELNSTPGVLLAVYQLPDANGLKVAEAIKKEMAKLKKQFPDDIEYAVLYDTTKFVEASIAEVVETLYIAVALVILVVFLFLQDWRSTLIPAIAIPVSLIGTFAALLALGYSINLITLFGLILAIGVVVDDAIVVIENVNRIMDEEGLDPVAATAKTMDQVSSPVIATTLVLMAVFVPVMFLPGITGELYRQFAVTISVSVLISSLNALTLSPALCATILRPGGSSKKKLFFIFRWFNLFFDWLTAHYSRLVSFLVRKSALVIIAFLILMGITYQLYTVLPSGFVPEEDQGAFMVDIQLPDGASQQRTYEVVRQVTDIMHNTPGMANVMTVTGYGMLAGVCSSNYGFAVGVLENWSKRKTPNLSQSAILKSVQEKFNAIPQANIFAFGVPTIPGLGTTGGFEFILEDREGGDSQNLAEVMGGMILGANQDPKIGNSYCTFRANVPQIFLEIDRDKVKKLGVDLSGVFSTLQTELGSKYVNDYNEFGKVYKVKVEAEKEFRNQKVDIGRLYARNKSDEMVPLSTLLSTKMIFGPQVLNRYNMFDSVTINGNAASGCSSGQAINAMEEVADKTLPDGFAYEWTGSAYQEILAGNQTTYIFILALTFIFLFLVAQYESWMIPFAVILSVPVAFFGALLGVWLMKLDNNIYTQIGLVLLFGLASKTAILIVEFAKEQRDNEGKSIIEAASFAAKLRFRAVCMTAISFVLGVFPLVIAIGAGAASRRSLGTAVFGGMLVAGIVGTILIPSFYVVIQSLIEWGSGKKNFESGNGRNGETGNLENL